jgi:hypothetical protein
LEYRDGFFAKVRHFITSPVGFSKEFQYFNDKFASTLGEKFICFEERYSFEFYSNIMLFLVRRLARVSSFSRASTIFVPDSEETTPLISREPLPKIANK